MYVISYAENIMHEKYLINKNQPVSNSYKKKCFSFSLKMQKERLTKQKRLHHMSPALAQNIAQCTGKTMQNSKEQHI